MCMCVCVHMCVCSEIYPYVVITIGLENILIIVKAVISTPEEVDVSQLHVTVHLPNVCSIVSVLMHYSNMFGQQ